MKQKSNSAKISFNSAKSAMSVAALVLLVGGASVVYFNTIAKANSYDEQINALRNQNKQYEARAAELRVYAGSLAEEIARLDAEKQVILEQIGETSKRLEQLAADITQAKKDIEANQEALGMVIKDMYMASQITPLERLASSKTISDYIDEETQRNNMQRVLVSKVEEIDARKKELEEKKRESEQVLASQQAQRDDLAAKEAAKAKILADTKGQEASYKALADKNNTRIAQLKAQQEEEMRQAALAGGFNVPTGVVGGGGYPGVWARAPIDTMIDSWGLYNRECVSYAAWKVWSTGRFVPHFQGMGHAYQWVSTTARHGIRSGTTPKEGSVAYWNIGTYGHVMYVEKLNGDGTMWVSDYNWNRDGAYHHYKRSTAGLTYIYF